MAEERRIRKVKVEVYMETGHDDQTVMEWSRVTLANSVTSPSTVTGEAEVAVREVERGLRLCEVAPQLVRPPLAADEAYRVQIPGLREGVSVAVKRQLSVSEQEELARILKEQNDAHVARLAFIQDANLTVSGQFTDEKKVQDER